MITVEKLLKSRNFDGDETLAHPVSGEKQTSREWAEEANSWEILEEHLDEPEREFTEEDKEAEILEQFASLEEVE